MEEKLEAVQNKMKDLHVSLKVENTEIKELKEQISSLKPDMNELEKRIKSLERKVEGVVRDTALMRQKSSELKETHERMKGRNMELWEQIGNLKETIQDMKRKFQEEDARLRKKLEDHIYATPCALHLKIISSAEAREREDNLLSGKLCWRIQSLIYKKILPPTEYHEKRSYKVEFIERDINLLEDEGMLNWQDYKVTRAVRAMQAIQERRNETVHPSLDEKTLKQVAKRMHEAGNMYGWIKLEHVLELINMWKKLKQMQ